ncbi:TetR/AcrR family transcriptional regulator [Dictyobacter aurantiacus]|nr:TetR/AcrR family transcriptional regulator [Dictyobacter aurantiacus]
MNKQRDYRSPLRQEQAKRTREQILDGLIQTMAQGGLADLSIPAVARVAGVSVPTIYRYFHTKRELIESLGSYIVQKSGLPTVSSLPQNPEELIALIKDVFLRYEGIDEMLRAAAMSELSYEMRQQALPQRLGLIDEALRPVMDRFDEQERIHLRNSIFILTTTATIRAFRDYLNLTPEEAVETVAWAIRALTSSSSQKAVRDATSPPDVSEEKHTSP